MTTSSEVGEEFIKNENNIQKKWMWFNGALSGNVGIVSDESAFTNEDQKLFDYALSNNLDIISNNRLFDELKKYERMFHSSSEEFYDGWMKGEKLSTPEIHRWMSIYRDLLSKKDYGK